MRLLADSIEIINFGGPSSPHLVLVVSKALEVIETRNEVVDIGRRLGTAAKDGEERAASVQSIAK